MCVYASCIYHLQLFSVCVLYLALLYFTYKLYRAPLKISIQLLSRSPVKTLQLQLQKSMYTIFWNDYYGFKGGDESFSYKVQ